MVRAAWWQTMRQLLNPAARRGSGRRRDRRQRPYRPWPETLEGRLAPTVTLSISNPAPFPKPDTGQLMGMFVVTRSGDLAPAVQVNYQTQDGTGPNGAHAGVDYVATTGTLMFAANQTMATITVPIIGNNIFQADKTFTVSLTNPQPFAPQQTFATGSTPVSVAVGDFNGDGKPDLAIANFQANTVSVLLNTTAMGATTPSFAAQQTFATGGGPEVVAVGDFNSDGKPDLAAVNYADGTVSVLLNTTAMGATTPSFAAQQTFAVGSHPQGLAVGDFNGDGKPDLAVANTGTAATPGSTVSVLLNTTAMGATTPSFTAQQTFTTGSRPVGVAVGDFNGDGEPDLAITNQGANTVSVLLNTTAMGATTPSFAAQQTFATGANPFAVAVGDFNGDGKPDLAVANLNDNTVSVLLNTTAMGATTPSFAAQQTFATGTGPISLAVGDFNGDGKPDLAITNEGTLPSPGTTVTVLFNTTAMGASAPSFAPQQTFTTGNFPRAVAVGDFNGDGAADLAVANSTFPNGTVSVLLNSGIIITGSPATGTISSAPEAPMTITVVAGSTPQSAPVNTAFATALAVDVRDAGGNLVQGVSVTFTAPTSGASGKFGSATSVMVVTNASGRATAPTFTANATTGTYMVTAQAMGGSNPSTSFTLTNTAGAPAMLTITSGNNQSTPVATAFPMNLVVTLTDQSGNPVPGVSIIFTAPTSGAGASFMGGNIGTTDANGQVSKTAIANVVAGSYTVTAMTLGGTTLSANFTLTNTPGTVDHFHITTTAANPQVAGVPFSVTVTAQDLYGNTATGYTGTIHFRSADPHPATLPADFTFMAADQGSHTFANGVTLFTPGTWDVTAMDTMRGITGAALVNVVATAPTTTVLVSSLNPAAPGQAVTFTATVSTTAQGAGTPAGTVTFFDGTTTLGTMTLNSSGVASLTTSTLSVGKHTITATYNGGTQGGVSFAPSTSTAVVETVRFRYFAVAGAPGLVQVRRDSDGSLVTEFAPYGANYTGPVTVAVGDVNGDGIPDLVTGAGAGNPDVRVFDGLALENGTFSPTNSGASLLAQWFAYGLNFNVGANVAVGDVEKDGFADVVTGATVGNPHVKVYSGKDIANHTFNPNGSSVVAQWFAYGLQFNIGANVAVGDVNGDGYAEVVTGASAGNPHVKVYNGKDIALHTFNPDGSSVLAQWFAFGLQFNIGATVAVGDVNGDGFGDVIAGASSGNPQVKVYDGKAIANGSFQPANPDSSLLGQFYAYDRLNANVGVSVAAADFEGTGKFDILTGPTQSPANFRVVKGNATGIMPPAVNGIDLVATDLTDGLFVGAG